MKISVAKLVRKGVALLFHGSHAATWVSEVPDLRLEVWGPQLLDFGRPPSEIPQVLGSMLIGRSAKVEELPPPPGQKVRTFYNATLSLASKREGLAG